jgi:large subunit ribosomal protein L27
MAHKKGGGATSQHDDSAGRRLGIKRAQGQRVKTGGIICRQRGTVYHKGKNVKVAKDHTIFALAEGIVSFDKKAAGTFISVVIEGTA